MKLFRRMNVFNRMLSVLILFLIPILIVYAYSNQASSQAVKEEIEKVHGNRLTYLASMLDASVNQLAMNTISLSNDPNAKEFSAIPFMRDPIDGIRVRTALQDKINFLKLSNDLADQISVYSNITQDVISTNSAVTYDSDYIHSRFSTHWEYIQSPSSSHSTGFYLNVLQPITPDRDPSRANLIVEVKLSQNKIADMLDSFKAGQHGDPFFYNGTDTVIMNHTANADTTRKIMKFLNRSIPGAQGISADIDDAKYLINRVPSATLGWYLVDFIPVEETLEPITKSRNLFYVCIALLLAFSLVASYLLYRHVQVPIGELTDSVRKLKRGDYSTRLGRTSNNEFGFLYMQFNAMVEQIQDLMEKVYLEKLRAREAELKQLQSQINPHFLYNCLGFVINMTKLDNKEAVLAMSYNLSDYYRYTTRVEKQTSTLKEEVDLIDNYLQIQNLRMHRIRYEIEVPPEMLEARVPKLLLQPIVENAVLHGVRNNLESGIIRIAAERVGEECRITVEDNGAGLTDEQRFRLTAQLDNPLSDGIGCGTWNVHQRLRHSFGEGAGLEFTGSQLGGLKTVLRFRFYAES